MCFENKNKLAYIHFQNFLSTFFIGLTCKVASKPQKTHLQKLAMALEHQNSKFGLHLAKFKQIFKQI
jgi:hypothetical protein